MPDSPLPFESQSAKSWLDANLTPSVDAATGALIGPDNASSQFAPSHGPQPTVPSQPQPQAPVQMPMDASHATTPPPVSPLPQSAVSKKMQDLTSATQFSAKPPVTPPLTGIQAGEEAFKTMFKPKTSDEAALASKDKPGYMFPDDQGHYYLKGKQLSDYQLYQVAPDVWNKRHAQPVGTVSKDTRGPVQQAFDNFLNENPIGQTLNALKQGAMGEDVPSTGLLVDQAQKAKLAKMGAAPSAAVGAAKDAFDYAVENPEAVPKDVALAIPKGIHKFGQMTVGAVGGITEAIGDAAAYAGVPKGQALADMGSHLQNYVSNPMVNSALGLGEGNEDPLGGFLSNLVSMAPALGMPEAAVAPFFGATGFGEAYGRARAAGATPGQAAASGLISGATNYLAGKFVPEGLKPGALNPLFREALPQNVAMAALNAAQLTAGQNVSRMVYDRDARPSDWTDALSKLEAGYFQTLPMLMGVHALGAYRAFKAANAEDFEAKVERNAKQMAAYNAQFETPEGRAEMARNAGKPGFDYEGKPITESAPAAPHEDMAILRAQDPSTSEFITNLILQADTPEAAELARQRLRSMYRQKKDGDFFMGQFDKFFPPITSDNFKTWGPQIPGVTQAPPTPTKVAEPTKGPGNEVETPAAIPAQPENRGGIAAPGVPNTFNLSNPDQGVAFHLEGEAELNAAVNARMKEMMDSGMSQEDAYKQGIKERLDHGLKMIQSLKKGDIVVDREGNRFEVSGKKRLRLDPRDENGGFRDGEFHYLQSHNGEPDADGAWLLSGMKIERAPEPSNPVQSVTAPIEPATPEAQPTEPEHKSPLQLSREAGAAANPRTTVAPINIHPNVTPLTSAYGDENRPENIGMHSPATSQTVAHRAVAQSMFSLMAGAAKDAGVDPNSDDVKATIHNVTNALSTNSAVDQVARAWGQMGVPEVAIDALRATQVSLKNQGLDINKAALNPDTSTLHPEKGAARAWSFLDEFHKQLGERVQNMGVTAPQWLRETVARMGKLVEPGGRYDTAYRKGMGLPIQEQVPQSVSTQPIAPTSQPMAGSSITYPERHGLADKVERIDDPDSLKALEDAKRPQVSPDELPSVNIAGMEASQEIGGDYGRTIGIYGPRQADGKRPHISVDVLPDGDLFVRSKDNAGVEGKGVGKQLDMAAVQLAMGHFPEVKPTNHLLGSATESAIHSRDSYPGTVTERSALGDTNTPVSTPISSITEYHYDQPAQEPISPARPANEAAIAGADSSPVQEPVPTVATEGRGTDVAEREPQRLLESDRENGNGGSAGNGTPTSGQVALPPEVQARVNAAIAATKHLFQSEMGVGSVRDMHTEMVEDTNWGNVNPYDQGGPAPFMTLGLNSMVYPAPKSSPYKFIANMTPGCIWPGKIINAIKLGKLAGVSENGLASSMTGPAMIVGLVAHLGEDGAAAFLSGLGYDSYAKETSPGMVEIFPTGEPIHMDVPVPKTVTPKTVKFERSRKPPVIGPASSARGYTSWGIKQDGTFGQLNYAEPTEPTAPEPISAQPIHHAPVIADKDQRAEAIHEGQKLYRTNHFRADDLLVLARKAGVPLGDEEITSAKSAGIKGGLTTQEVLQVLNRANVEAGIEEPRALAGKNVKGMPGSREYTPGELASKFTNYIKDGGFPDIVYWLSKNPDFQEAMESGARYGRDQFGPITRGEFQALPGTEGLGSNSKYLFARSVLNKMVRDAGSKESDLSGISKALMGDKISKEHNLIMSLAAVAATQYMPDFFSVSAKRLADIKARELQKGAYEDEPKVPILSGHFDARPEEKSGFSPTLDVYNDGAGQYRERLGTGHEEPFDFEAKERLPHTQVLRKLVGEVAARGAFTPGFLAEHGVQYAPKIDHEPIYQRAVIAAQARPEAVADLGPASALAQPENMPVHLIGNGYATLMLNARTGTPKQPFHVDAYRVDPSFEKYYTLGEQTVLNLNIGSYDGMPVPNYILSAPEIEILLDHNNPMYNVTAEKVNARVNSDGQIMMAGTPMRSVSVKTPDGRTVSMLVPRQGMSSDYAMARSLSAAPESRVAPGQAASGIRISDPEKVRERVEAAAQALRNADEDWAQRLGDGLMDQYTTALTALDAAKNAKAGDYSAMLSLKGEEGQAAAVAMSDPKLMKKLQAFADETKARLNSGKDPIEIAARARAAEVMDALNHAKNDVPWDSIFHGNNNTGVAAPLPTLVAANAIRNREAMMDALDEFGIVSSDPATKYAREVFEKINPLFFEELGVNVSNEPDLDTGLWDELHRVMKLSNGLKSTATATQVAHLTAHELGHAFTAYMGLPMRLALENWYNSESAAYRKLNPRFNAVMESSAINPDNGRVMSVGDIYKSEGNLVKMIITPESGKALMVAHPDLAAHMREMVDGDNNVIGYRLSRHFGGYDSARYLNPEEFIAETFHDALTNYAQGLRKTPGKTRELYNRYLVRLRNMPSAATAMDAIHRNMGRMIDTLVGKNTMRRYIGYLVNAGGTMERGLREGNPDKAFPSMLKRGELAGKGVSAGGPPIKQKPLTPEELAERDHPMAHSVGRTLNRLRAPLMSILAPYSKSQSARAAAYTLNGALGENTTDYYTHTSQIQKYSDAAHKLSMIDAPVRRALVRASEASPVASKARKDGIGSSVKMKGADGSDYLVNIDAKGKYQDAIPWGVVEQIDSFEHTGDFTGPLKGLGAPVQFISKSALDATKWSLARLAKHLALDKEHVANVDDQIKSVKYYLHRTYRYRGYTHLDEALFGHARGGQPLMTGDEATGTFNTGLDPSIDFAVQASSLIDRKFEFAKDAYEKGYFPQFTNPVEMANSGPQTLGRLNATLNMLSGLFESGQAVNGYDNNPHTKLWPTFRAMDVGLPEEMFGPSLHTVRVEPDALMIMRNGFQPDLLSRGSLGRYVAVASGMMNSGQLLGANDAVNAFTHISSFAGVMPEVLKESAIKGGRQAVTRRVLAGMGAGVGAGAFAAVGLPPVAGAALGALTVSTARTLINRLKPLTMGTAAAVSEGHRIIKILQSPKAMMASRLSSQDRNAIAAMQAVNFKLLETEMQMKHSRKLADEFFRQGKHVAGGVFKLAHVINWPIQKMQNGQNGWGGKVPAKMGIFSLLSDAISKPYQDKNGIADFSNPELLQKVTMLADELDDIIGAPQYRRLHMNPATIAISKMVFRAFGYRFGTQKAMTIFAADVANNLGTHGMTGHRMPWADSYEAARLMATAGATMQAKPKSGSNWAWRNMSIALMNIAMGATLGARIEAMMSHVIWPNSNYSQSDFGRRTYDWLLPRVGKKAALAGEGWLSVLPPKDSSTAEAMRYIAYETILGAPEVGPNDPTTGRPRRLIIPGHNYAKDFSHPPFEMTLNPKEFLAKTPEKLGEWFTSGRDPLLTALWENVVGHDAINNPTGIGDPFRNVEAVKRFNEWSENQPGDKWWLQGVEKGLAKSLAHLASAPFSLFSRNIDQMANGGNWAVPISQLIGGRVMPAQDSLSEAERFAFDKAFPKGGEMPVKTQKKAAENRLLAVAKQHLSEYGDSKMLDKLRADGEITDQEYSRIHREYIENNGRVRPPLIRFLRRAMDSTKETWREAYLLSTPKEKSEIRDYFRGVGGSGYSKSELEKIDKINAWFDEQDKK